MNGNIRSAFTLIEMLIVVVIMAILAATIIPQFTHSAAGAEAATTKFNLHTLRSQIELFKAQHGGVAPALDAATNTITELTTITTFKGQQYGPYLTIISEDSITTGSGVYASISPIGSTDVTGNGGWWYDATTGEIHINNSAHVDK